MSKYSRNIDKDTLKPFIVKVAILARDRKHAEKLVGYAFDNMMSFEDKCVFNPVIVGGEKPNV